MAIRVSLAADGKDVGFAVFYAAPIHQEQHFNCSPPRVLSFEQAKQIAAQLAKGKESGRVGIYQWTETGPDSD
jgi:hypothetical protein